MRVVIVGASGNVGTALLRRLATDATVTSVVGVARRVPDRVPPAPYDIASWQGVDLGASGPDEPVVHRLTEVVTGADAVVHLAWAVQPSHDRARLRATNVVGTRRVLEAVRRAGVPQLVVASSVGAYSPAEGDQPRAEDWPTDGVRSSSYSVDKAAVERMLDEAVQRLPSLSIARLRPALIFQRASGREIGRYFFGPFLPERALGHVPVLAWPARLRLQVVHADDVAAAYREAVVRRVSGPFNVAAPGLLHAEDVAPLVGADRVVEVSRTAARAAVAAGWHLRLVPVGPGWLDMAFAAPVLDTGRARRELGWQAGHDAAATLAEAVRGISDGAGTASPPLRPRHVPRRPARGRPVPEAGIGR